MMFALVGLLQAAAPQVQRIEFSRPAVAVDVEFSQIRGVRELADGRILVSDRIEQKVMAINPRTGVSTVLGRVGGGPGEYRYPTSLFATPGDSTILIDEGNSRVAVIGPDARITRVWPMMLPGVGFPMGSRGRDNRGRFYVQIPAWIHNRGPGKDSVVIVRFDEKANRVDTLTVIKGSTPPPHPEYSPEPRIPMVIFAPQDGWAVAPDGAFAVVRSGDYHVEWTTADGVVTRGPRVPYTPIVVSEPEKTAYTKRFLERTGVGGRTGNIEALTEAEKSPQAVARMVKANTFAERKGAFTDAAPIAGADGSLWVERSGPVGSPAEYDVFNRRAERVRTVRLAPASRLAAVGRTMAYVIREDDDGVEHLELHKLPS
ncbi:MAG: hypothetical protein P3A28_03090 [Gemmatimonadota bacterium]|nr:hypothetical protein [Gemmatimonadota bacterium]